MKRYTANKNGGKTNREKKRRDLFNRKCKIIIKKPTLAIVKDELAFF